jgi:hypothetical protein
MYAPGRIYPGGPRARNTQPTDLKRGLKVDDGVHFLRHGTKDFSELPQENGFGHLRRFLCRRNRRV